MATMNEENTTKPVNSSLEIPLFLKKSWYSSMRPVMTHSRPPICNKEPGEYGNGSEAGTDRTVHAKHDEHEEEDDWPELTAWQGGHSLGENLKHKAWTWTRNLAGMMSGNTYLDQQHLQYFCSENVPCSQGRWRWQTLRRSWWRSWQQRWQGSLYNSCCGTCCNWRKQDELQIQPPHCRIPG